MQGSRPQTSPPSTAPSMPNEAALVRPVSLVVYIEDNPSNVELMRAVLETLEGIELVAIPTAELGIEVVRSRRPRLVITDINLPGMSGYDAMQRLKEWPETRTIPVIAVTAGGMPGDRARALELGFKEYFGKPIKLDRLLETVEHLLRELSSPPMS